MVGWLRVCSVAQLYPHKSTVFAVPVALVSTRRSEHSTRSRVPLSDAVALSDVVALSDAVAAPVAQERQREGAEINTSLHALKNCVRAFAERARSGRAARMPFRDALLTRLLADSFGDSCQLAVLGCVSPASAATEHSLSTLRTVMELAGGGEEAQSWTSHVRRVGEARPPPGGAWFGCSC
mmetsp:Transcript_5260/g.16868  ORF Transcript_5260/g.16868 Transcript_5260/m.16868 type:complete len:181 (+) Transcript_5260:850-1392(+)